MKKIYLVKKDPARENAQDNWVQMNAREFAQFIKTEEGVARQKNFAQLDACALDDYMIIAECTEELARDWKREKNAADYRARIKKEGEVREVSYQAMLKEDASEIDEEKLLIDPCCVEDKLIAQAVAEQVRDAVSGLCDVEEEIVQCLFLGEVPMSIDAYARARHITRAAAYWRRNSALRKLKVLLEGTGCF